MNAMVKSTARVARTRLVVKEMKFGPKPAEPRSAFERQGVPISDPHFLQLMGWDSILNSSSGVAVTVDNALGVPAVWAAVNFMSGTLAGLPLRLYRRRRDGARVRESGGLSNILHDAVNDEMSSFEWRKYTFDQVFTRGRGVTYIERDDRGRILNLFPFDPVHVQVIREKDSSGRMRRVYEYRDGGVQRYDASEVLDLTFMVGSDMMAARSPILCNKNTIGLAIAADQYGAKIFAKGGIPPLVMQGPFQSGAGAQRASDDVAHAMEAANNDGRQVMTMPIGHELKALGFDAEKMQMVELRKFIIEEIARIWSLPPTFLQDLANGTFSNTEQQDLHFVKHTLKRWVEQAEQEMNLKFFGRRSQQYVEFSMDGLLRGDFKTRMEGNARAINTGQLTPNEAREMDNRPPMAGGDQLLIQGATVPLEDVEDDNANTNP